MSVPTLSDFFYSDYRELRILGRELDPKTDNSYQESLSWWIKLTGDPLITEIDDRMCAKFVRDLCQQRGKKGDKMMKSSVGKHVVNLKSILMFAGPRTATCRGMKIITDVPFMEAPRADQEPPCRDWSVAEMKAMYKACDVMNTPQLNGVSAPDWWRGILVLGYFTGLRIKALTSVEFSMVNECWLTVPARLSKRRKGKKQYLRREALEHIERLRVNGRSVILEWPLWETQRRMCYDRLRDLQDAAGIPEHRQFAFQSLRKTHLTVLASGEIDPDAAIKTAQISAGHTNSAVTRNHYVSGTIQDRLVAAAIDAMPSPCA